MIITPWIFAFQAKCFWSHHVGSSYIWARFWHFWSVNKGGIWMNSICIARPWESGSNIFYTCDLSCHWLCVLFQTINLTAVVCSISVNSSYCSCIHYYIQLILLQLSALLHSIRLTAVVCIIAFNSSYCSCLHYYIQFVLLQLYASLQSPQSLAELHTALLSDAPAVLTSELIWRAIFKSKKKFYDTFYLIFYFGYWMRALSNIADLDEFTKLRLQLQMKLH